MARDPKAVTKNKIKTGRPSKYKPEYPQMLIDHMAQGLSFDTFAGVIGCCRDTLYEWLNTGKYKAFSDAKGIGTAKRNLLVERMYTASALGRTIKDRDGTILRPKDTMMIYWTKNTLGWSDKIDSKNENTNHDRLIIEGIDD